MLGFAFKIMNYGEISSVLLLVMAYESQADYCLETELKLPSSQQSLAPLLSLTLPVGLLNCILLPDCAEAKGARIRISLLHL